MLQQRLHHRKQFSKLEQMLAAMPDYPIYREANGQYSIYMHGRLQVFDTLASASLGQLCARANWLRAHPYDVSMNRSAI